MTNEIIIQDAIYILLNDEVSVGWWRYGNKILGKWNNIQLKRNMETMLPTVEQELKDAEQAAINKKASGKQKIKRLRIR